MNLPPPTEPNRSCAVVFMSQHVASTSASRLGDGLECVDAGSYVRFVFTGTADAPGVPARRVIASIHRKGIPAVIAELQRLMGYGTEGS